MKTIVVVSVICVGTLFGHYYLNAESEKAQLRQALELSDQKYKIANDQIRDLMYSIRATDNESGAEKQAGYIAGVLDGINRQDHHLAIWHDGYNRANDVHAEMVKSMEGEAGVIPTVKEDSK